LILTQFDSLAFKFPFLDDLDPDDTPQFVSLDLGDSSAFITGRYPNLFINPVAHAGVFPISVTVKDNNKNSLSATYKFTITVKAEENSLTINNNSESNNSKT
jgi:hypothetical protein